MKWSVGSKIASMNAVAIFILLLVGIANYYSTDRMLIATNWRQHSYQVKENLYSLLSLLVDAETGQRGYLITKQDIYLEPYHRAMNKIFNQVQNIKQLTKDNVTQQNKLHDLEMLIKKRLIIIKNTFQQINLPNELLTTLNLGKKSMDDIRIIINSMIQEEDRLLQQRIKNFEFTSKVVFYTIISGTCFAILFLIIVGIVLTHNIGRPLKEMSQLATHIAAGELDYVFVAKTREDEVGVLSQKFADVSDSLQKLSYVATNIAAGDLTVEVIPKSDNDILAQAFKQMLNNLRKFTHENNEVIKLLNRTVNEILTSASQFVAAGTETATAVSETTSTIEEVKQTSQVANKKAKSVSETAQRTADISRTGKKSTGETHEGMIKIRNQMISIGDSMMLLSEQTKGISNIVETVDDLAQQSNLLSVNASIEAEKAGEQGRGFRIVAQEIKSLADQSKQATYRVREILSDIQKATTQAMLATEQGNTIAENGVNKATIAGEAIEKLSKNIEAAVQSSIQILATSQQQRVGLEQAAQAMENIKQASFQNVEAAKQLQNSANDLKGISEKITNLIKKYKIKQREDHHERSRRAAEEIA